MRSRKAKSSVIKQKPDRLLQFTNLRKVAEDRLLSLPEQAASSSPERLLHELRVHQIELELQNEELRRAQVALEQSLDRYVSLYEFAPVGYLTLTENGTIEEANLTCAVSLGGNRATLLKQHFPKFIAPEYADFWHQHFHEVMRSGKSKSCEVKIRRADGHLFYAHLDCLILEPKKPPLANADALMMRVALTDITELKLAEQSLRVAATVFESQEGMMVTDENQVILRVNHAFTQMTGYQSDDIVGCTPSRLRSGRHDEVFYTEMWKKIHSTGLWQGEVWDRKRNGDVFPAWVTITAVKNESGAVTHYVATFLDISARKAAEEEMQLLAFYDPLTRLPNRRLMLDRLYRAILVSARTLRYCALMFIDLDKFKDVNDNLGHDIGDMLLQLVAQRLSISIREGDTVARMGGDEFMVMLENLSESQSEAEKMAETIGKKILVALNQPFLLAGKEYISSASIGVTLFTNHHYTIPELQKQADLAMYQAKFEGRNQLCFFRPDMQAIQGERGCKI